MYLVGLKVSEESDLRVKRLIGAVTLMVKFQLQGSIGIFIPGFVKYIIHFYDLMLI